MRHPPPSARLTGAMKVFLHLVDPRHRDLFEGDLLEEYEHHVLPARGRAAAHRWLWGQVLRGSLVALGHRVYDRSCGRRQARGSGRGTGGIGGSGHMERLWQDVRYALRRLVASPGFTLVSVLSLGLGIGANTGIFSLVNAVMVRRPPMADPGSLVEIYAYEQGGTLEYLPVSWADLEDVAALDVFEDVTAWEMFFGSTQTEGISLPVMGELVAGNFFDVLGLELAAGRAFMPEEDILPGRDPVVMLSYPYWETRYGADPAVLGETLRLNGQPFTIIGVASRRFTGMVPGMTIDIWVPRMMADKVALFQEEGGRLERRGPQSAFFRGRLRQGATPEQAEAALSGLLLGLAELYPDAWADYTFEVIPTLDVSIHPQADKALMPVAVLLMAVVGMVLFIACTNLASFLLARGADRRKEIALRLALGAGRTRLVRQLLTETIILALVGGAVGVALAHWTLNLAMRFQPPLLIPINLNVGLDRNVLFFALAASAATGLLFGLLPALQSTRPDLASSLKEDGGSAPGGSTRWTLRNGLVVVQVAVSLVLLVGSGLFVRSLVAVQAVDPGFHSPGGAMVFLEMSSSGYGREASEPAFERLQELMLAEPSIDQVAMADRLPLALTISITGITIPGYQDPDDPEGRVSADAFIASPSYFEVMDIPIVAGRAFQPSDDRTAPPVTIISESLARRYWPGQSPVGQQILRRDTAVTVVGVAADIKVRTLGEAPRTHIYFPFPQEYSPLVTFVAQGRSQAVEVLTALRRVVREFDPNIVVMSSNTMEEHLGLMLFGPRMAALLLAVAGGLALLLAAVGLYGVVSYSASRRTREMGIRISIGADRASVTRMVIGGGLKLVGIGSVVGLVLAFGMVQLASRFLYGVTATDPLTFLGVPALLAAVAALAAYLPARRAGRVDPVTALRSD